MNDELDRLDLSEFRLEEGVTLYVMLSRVQERVAEEEYSLLLDRVHSIIEEYELESAKRTDLLPHAQETLQTLKDGGLKTAVVTNNGRAATGIVIERFNLSSLIDILVTREDSARWKPDGASVKEALKQLRVEPKDAVFVGDSTIDVLAARDSGVISVALPTGPTNIKRLLDTAPDYVISSLAELPLLIDRLQSGLLKR